MASSLAPARTRASGSGNKTKRGQDSGKDKTYPRAGHGKSACLGVLLSPYHLIILPKFTALLRDHADERAGVVGENAVFRVVDSHGVCVLEILDRENIQFIFRALIQLKERRQIHGQTEAGRHRSATARAFA